MKIRKMNKLIKSILVFLFGVEFGDPIIPLKYSLEYVHNNKLKKLLCEDEFGLYKKDNVSIPHKYKKIYKQYKKAREELIYAKYYKLNISARYGLRKRYYFFEEVVIPSESDKIIVENLLNKG